MTSARGAMAGITSALVVALLLSLLPSGSLQRTRGDESGRQLPGYQAPRVRKFSKRSRVSDVPAYAPDFDPGPRPPLCKSLSPQTDAMANPTRKRRILVILRGISYSGSYRAGANSFERTYHNFFSYVVEPWRAQGHSVDVALATYTSEKIADVLEAYRPAWAYVHNETWKSRTKIHSFLDGLLEAEKRGGSRVWDFIMVTRFDIKLRRPVTEYPIDMDKLTWPWRERSMEKYWWADWRSLPRVGDGLHMFSAAYLERMTAACRRMIRDRMTYISNASYDNCHRILIHMMDQGVDLDTEVNFIVSDFCASRFGRGNPIYVEATGYGKEPTLGKSTWPR